MRKAAKKSGKAGTRGAGKPFARGKDPRRPPPGPYPGRFQVGPDSRRAVGMSIVDRVNYTGPTITELCRSWTPEIVHLWSSVMMDDKAQTGHRITAAQALAERGWGKPSQEIALQVSRGPDIQELSRDALMGVLARAAAREGVALPAPVAIPQAGRLVGEAVPERERVNGSEPEFLASPTTRRDET